MLEHRASIRRQYSKQISTISQCRVKQWIDLLAKEDEMFEESIEIVKT
jgi:hypothetical protein